MSRTHVLGFARLEDAQSAAAFYSTKYKVMIIGPMDDVVLAREKKDGVAWRSGDTEDLHLMIATKSEIVGPKDPG